jgi:peptide/nickel transport system permease protein
MSAELENKENTLDKNENEIALRETEGLSQGQIIFRRFVRHKAAMSSVIVLMFIILFSYTGSGIHLGDSNNKITVQGWWPYQIDQIDPEGAVESMCANGIPGCPTLDLIPEFIDGTGMQVGAHPLGMDTVGTDYLALVLRGAEQSIMVMLIVGLMGVAIGTVVGAIAGFFGGIVDAVLMRLTDMFLVMPTLIIGAVIGFRFGNLGVVPLAVMLGLFAWMGLARFVRTEFLSLREREFVDAARVAGASNRRIIFKHILPNAVGVIIVAGTLLMSGAILTESALSFLGFGVRAPDVSLGLLISRYQDVFTVAPWLFWWPGVFIISIALCVNFIGDGLRDAFDPRQKRRITLKERLQARELKSTAATKAKA